MSFFERWPRSSLIAVFALALGFLVLDSASRLHHFSHLTRYRLGSGPPRSDPGSPTGYAGSVRDEILPLSSADGYQWIIHAQSLQADGGWRVRRTDIDNFPTGREVHWNSGLLWWLLLLARGQSSTTGMAAGPSIERAALYASPLLLALLLVGLGLAIYRRFGAVPAGALVLGLATAPRFAEFFQAAYFDHHGPAAIAGMTCVLFAAAAGAGWVRGPGMALPAESGRARGTPAGVAPRDEVVAKRWIIASALAGSAGLWVSAASQVPVLIGLGLGACAAAVRWPRSESDGSVVHLPCLWRLWGWAGALGSLGFYLLEYFPASLGLRMEVNHPLYALAWAGAGELLFRVCRKLQGGSIVARPADRIAMVLAFVAMSLGPALILLAPGRCFWVSDRFFWSMNRDVAEIHNIWRHIREIGIRQSLTSISPLPLLAIPLIMTLWRARLDRLRKAMLAVTIVPALLLTALSAAQVRWLGNQEALWVCALVVAVAALAGDAARLPVRTRRAGAVFLAFSFLLYPVVATRAALRELRPPLQLGYEDRLQLVMRDVAQRLSERGEGKPRVVLSGPTGTTEMIYFGGFRGLGTLYWENRDGLESAAAIYGASSAEEALQGVVAHRITHIVYFSWEDYGRDYARLHRAAPPGADERDVFSFRTASPLALPVWTTPLDYRIPPELGLTDQEVLILEVHPDQSADQHFIDVGGYCLGRGDLAGAETSFRRSLRLRADRPEALLGLARTLARAGRAAEALSELDLAIEATPAQDRPRVANDVAVIGREISATDPRAGVSIYRRALVLDPHCRAARNNLAWVLATSSDPGLHEGTQAVELAIEAVREDGGGDPLTLDTLAAAYARAGRFEEAISTASRAISLAESKGSAGVTEIRARLDGYRTGRPYTTPARPVPGM